MHKISLLLLLLLLVLAVAVVGSAQGKNGIVSATVLDQNNAAIAGVSVTLTHVGAKAVQKCVSSDKGECKFEGPAGEYELAADLPGRFCPLKVSDLRVKENETLSIAMKLQRCADFDRLRP